MSPVPEAFHPGEHALEVKKKGLFGGGPIAAEVLDVSEAFVRFKTSETVKFGQELKFRLYSEKHKDELTGVGLVSKIEPCEGGLHVEIVVDKKAPDHDTKIRAMRSWYQSDRYKARESTRRILAQRDRKITPPPPS